MAAIFNYGFDVATKNFKKANLDLYTLSDYENLLKLAVDKMYITENDEKTLIKWRKNPEKWSV